MSFARTSRLLSSTPRCGVCGGPLEGALTGSTCSPSCCLGLTGDAERQSFRISDRSAWIARSSCSFSGVGAGGGRGLTPRQQS